MAKWPTCMLAAAALLVLAGGLVRAQEPKAPPAPPGLSASAAKERTALLAELANAKTEPDAREIEDRLWKFWLRAPDKESQRLLDLSKAALLKMDYGNALARLEELTKHVPDYAEGWNQLATVLFLAGSYEQSLKAIEETLKREPMHYGALAGRGIILHYFLGREEEAQSALKQALKINPWLKERRLIKKEPGKKI